MICGSVTPANLQLEANMPMLYILITTYHINSHLKSFKRYKNRKCQFNTSRFFSIQTILVETFKSVNELARFEILKKRECILSKVAESINPIRDRSF